MLKTTILFFMMILALAQPNFAAHTKHARTHTKHKTLYTAKINHSHATIRKKVKINLAIAKKTKHTMKKNSRHLVTTQTTVNTNNITPTSLPGYSLSSIEKSLVNFVRDSVTSLRYTAYKLGGTRIDTSRGIYVVDCSTYVDHLLKSVYPNAYTSLTSWSGTEKPTTDDYYHYFTNLSDRQKHWNTIDEVESLRPGDIIVFRFKNRIGNETGGHVMVVMDKPLRDGNTFMVRITDAAPTGHSKDTRMPHASGIGIGTMLLKVDPHTFQPYAYAWKVGSRFETNVTVAMARPVNFSTS